MNRLEPDARTLSLQRCGVLLPRTLYPELMLGYDVHLSQSGEFGPHPRDALLTFEVRGTNDGVVTHDTGVRVAGVWLAPRQRAALGRSVAIEIPGWFSLEYRRIRERRYGRYVGEIRLPGESLALPWGEEHLVGRAPDASVRLPNRPGVDNVHWPAHLRNGDTVPGPNGPVDKAGFCTDWLMVAFEMVAIDLRGDRPVLRSRARHVPSYVRRRADVVRLDPTTEGPRLEYPLELGDELLVGNQVFRLAYWHVGREAGRTIG